MRWPLRIQILLPMVCLMAATLLVVSSVDAFLAARQAKRQIESRLHDVGETLATANYPLTDAVLRQMRGFSGAEFALISEQHQLLAASRPFQATLWRGMEANSHSAENIEAVATLADGRYFHTTVPINEQRAANGAAVLHIFYPERSYTNAWRLAVAPPLIVGAIALLLVIVSGAMIASRVARPLDRLRSQVDRIAEGDFHQVWVPERNDEIADLSRAVNEMARMLQRYEENVRRSEQLRTLGKLGGGIAHQIRNSLTGCRMALDLHTRGCTSEHDESLDVARQQLELMEEYIQRFLALGRTSEEPKQAFDLCQAIERSVMLVNPMARHAQVGLECELPAAGVMVLGNLNDLSQLVVNLLLNAVEATLSSSQGGRGQSVEVRVAVENSHAQIQVIDPGAGPSAEVANHLFEPLVSNKRDGVGLGLSVAKSVAEHHGGNLTWNRQDGKTCFRVELPVYEPVKP